MRGSREMNRTVINKRIQNNEKRAIMKILALTLMMITSNAFASDTTDNVSPAGMGDHSSVQKESTTTRGTKILGNPVMEHPTYPNSGQLQRRSNDMTGSDMATSSQMGSNENPTVPSEERGPVREAQEESAIGQGPYKNGEYQYLNGETEQ